MQEERLATVRALYDEVRFALPFRDWEEYPAVAPPHSPYGPREVTIQNNRARDVVKPCSGACPYCWVSPTAVRLRRAEASRRRTVDAAEVAAYLDTLVSLGARPYVAGEDTLDDLETLWWIQEAYEAAVAKYRTAIPKYLSSLIKRQPDIQEAVARGGLRQRPTFGFTTCGLYFIQHPERLDEFFSKLRAGLGPETVLSICLSWDPGKVASYAQRLRITQEDVFGRMGLTFARFAAHFPVDPGLGIEGQQYGLGLFQHDFGDEAAREGGKTFLRALTRAAGRHLRETTTPLLKIGTQIETYVHHNERSVRWAIGEGLLAAGDFWPVRELFTARALSGLTCRIRNRPYLDFATGTISADYTFPEFFRRRVIPASLERTLVDLGTQHPLVRRDGYVRDVVRYAIAVLPELADEPVVSAEQIVSHIYSDEPLKLKVELLAMLDYLLTTEEKALDVTFMPLALVNFLCADDLLRAYFRHCGALEQSRFRLLARHAAGFANVTSGVTSLEEVVANNRDGDRALFLHYLRGSFFQRLAARGIFAAEHFDAASVRGQSLGPVRPPLLPHPLREAATEAPMPAN